MTRLVSVRRAKSVSWLSWLSDWWFGFRNRLLSSPTFQRWSARFPLTRFVAQRRTMALFDLCAGFVYSQILTAAVRLRLCESLASGPLEATEVAARISLSTEATLRLLDATASLELVERRPDGRYGLGIHGAALLGNPAALPMIEHHALFYRDLADPVALLRGESTDTELRRFWSYAGFARSAPDSDAQVAAYSALMASTLSLIAEDILEAYPVARHLTLLDVGGGEGAFVEAVAARAAALHLMLFDLPPVAARARERLSRRGLADRVTVVGGDVFNDRLPVGADVVSLVRVLHDHDDEESVRVLVAVRAALSPGGVLLVAEPMSGTPGAERMGDAYFGLYLLAMGQGRPRTAERLSELLRTAGFGRVRARATRRPMLTRLLVASVN